MPQKALIIDDERLARNQLRERLAQFSELEVVAEADCVSEAVKAVERVQPDVVFLDIQMPGESGFDFLEQASGGFKVIFVTAFDSFALRAFNSASFCVPTFSRSPAFVRSRVALA